jgi:hypothetical protein
MVYSCSCAHFTYILLYDGELKRGWGAGGDCIGEVDSPWPIEHRRDYTLSSLQRTINLSLVALCVPVPRLNDLKWTCCLFCRSGLHVSGCAALCHFYCCLSLLWVSSNMLLDDGDKVTIRSFRNFAVCILYLSQVCTHLERQASGRLNFVRWRLILVGVQYETRFVSPF